ncbi:MAG: hypothetical protein ACK42Y_05770 [Candidatus Thermochlorobacter sp.]
MPDALILSLPGSTLGQSAVTLLLRHHLAIHYRAVFSEQRCSALTAAVYAARAFWNADFDGAHFSLGRSWYAHWAERRTRLYFQHAQASNRLVERFLSGMPSQIHALMSQALGAPVRLRAGWCGPGIHIFPASGWCAQHGGDIHFDTEGLLYPTPLAHTAALTMILMLQAPEQGGGLKLWQVRYPQHRNLTPAMLAAEHQTIVYQTGDLVIIDAYTLHQIQPFEGQRDRISITAHLAHTPTGWVIWF